MLEHLNSLMRNIGGHNEVNWVKKWYKNNHSFPEFVDLVLTKHKTNFVNGHWEPFSTHCNFCEVDYDVIGKMETFSDDVKYLIKLKKLEKRIPLNKAKLSVIPGKDNIKGAKSKTKITATFYMSQLTKGQTDVLYEMYHTDFEMFGSLH